MVTLGDSGASYPVTAILISESLVIPEVALLSPNCHPRTGNATTNEEDTEMESLTLEEIDEMQRAFEAASSRQRALEAMSRPMFTAEEYRDRGFGADERDALLTGKE
jgi:hypothetical protein